MYIQGITVLKIMTMHTEFKLFKYMTNIQDTVVLMSLNFDGRL